MQALLNICNILALFLYLSQRCMIKKLFALVLMMPFSVFAKPTIDVSTKESLKKSQVLVSESLSGAKKQLFQDTFLFIKAKGLAYANKDEKKALDIYKIMLDGKDADQIMKENPISPKERMAMKMMFSELN